MDSVFVSYSHQDAKFVERLIEQMDRLDINVTYDKWLIRVGDSIIEKIAGAIEKASAVIAVLSHNSVTSNWVRKELSLAMTGEIDGKSVKVLPVVIDDCSIPLAIADKLFADFRNGFYCGVLQLLDAIGREASPIDGDEYYRRLSVTLTGYRELEEILSSSNPSKIREFLKQNDDVLKDAFGARLVAWDFEWGAGPPIGCLLIGAGNSAGVHFNILQLGPTGFQDPSGVEIEQAAQSASAVLDGCHNSFGDFSFAVACRFKHSSIARMQFNRRRHGEMVATILMGRRMEYSEVHEDARTVVRHRSRRTIHVASYDRLFRETG
jgi:hypothetical protein